MVRKLLTAAALLPLGACAGILGIDGVTYDVIDASTSDGTAADVRPAELDASTDAREDSARAPDVDASLTYRDLVLSAKPIAYWRMNPKGGAIADETGQGNDLLYSGNAAPTKGAIAGDSDLATSFDGATGRADAMNPRAFDMLGDGGVQPFSLEAWVRYVPKACGHACSFPSIFSHISADPPNPREGYQLFGSTLDGGQALSSFSADMEFFDAGLACPNPTLPPQPAWVHVVYVYDGGVRLFLDDIVQPKPCSFIPTHGLLAQASPFQVGYHSGDGYFSGDLDELAVYDRALDLREILGHYSLGSGK
jgi:Concanavalin A-like lectin/glucanases superfamily